MVNLLMTLLLSHLSTMTLEGQERAQCDNVPVRPLSGGRRWLLVRATHMRYDLRIDLVGDHLETLIPDSYWAR